MKLIFKLVLLLSFSWSMMLGQTPMIGSTPRGVDVTYNITNATGDIAAMIADSLDQTGFVTSDNILDGSVVPGDMLLDADLIPDSHDAVNIGSDAVHWSNIFISTLIKSDDALQIYTEAGDITLSPTGLDVLTTGNFVNTIHDSKSLGADTSHWGTVFISSLIRSDDELTISTEVDDIILDPAGSDVSIDGNLSPATHDARDVGSDAVHWKRLYISDSLKSNNALVINTESGILLLDPDDEVRATTDFRPGTGSSYDLGAYDASWDSLFVDDVEIGDDLVVTDDASVGGTLTAAVLAITNFDIDTLSSSQDIVMDPTGGDVIFDSDIEPSTHDTYAIGTDAAHWGSIYMSDVLESDDALSINTEGGDITFDASTDTVRTASHLLPSAHDTWDLGSDNTHFREVYMSGLLKSDDALTISNEGGDITIASADELNISSNVDLNGDLDVQGALSKGSGTFKIPHPSPEKTETHNLYHSFVESPTAGDNLYRYRIELKESSLDVFIGAIKLPEYWYDLNENPQVWVTPVKMLATCTGWLAGNKIVVGGDRAGFYNVLLMGTRKDPIAVENWKGVEREK